MLVEQEVNVAFSSFWVLLVLGRVDFLISRSKCLPLASPVLRTTNGATFSFTNSVVSSEMVVLNSIKSSFKTLMAAALYVN